MALSSPYGKTMYVAELGGNIRQLTTDDVKLQWDYGIVYESGVSALVPTPNGDGLIVCGDHGWLRKISIKGDDRGEYVLMKNVGGYGDINSILAVE